MHMAVPDPLLQRACRSVGVSAEGAQLVRAGSNVVYRLAAPIVVRISPPSASLGHARRAVAVARWLESAGLPSVRLAAIEQPIVIDGHVVTFWQAVSAGEDAYATTREVAQVLLELHSLAVPGALILPTLSPFEGVANRIEMNPWIDASDRGFFLEGLTALEAQYADLRFTLPPGVIHGDANVGNVLHDAQGNPVVIDLDGFCVGPREWDLALTAIYYDSFGWHTHREYQAFADTYGQDIMCWTGYPTMRAVREFLMVSWIIERGTDDSDARVEARSRIATLRTGASRKNWRPY